MNQNKDYGKWFVNPAPGSGTGQYASPAAVLCNVCGRDIDPDEDCLENWDEEEVALFLCEQCWKEGKG